MNDAPRSYLTPAERDWAMMEASRLRALSLRREAIAIFWDDVARLLGRAAATLTRKSVHSQLEG